MYTIISGTNRVESHTEKVAAEYHRVFKEKNIDAAVFSLENVDVLNRNKDFQKIETEIFILLMFYLLTYLKIMLLVQKM